jgi:hypothetical protein
MKNSWLVLVVAVTFIAIPSHTVLADNCCGGHEAPKKSGDRGATATPAPDASATPSAEATVSVHGGTLTKRDSFVFETTIHGDQLRVYCFDAKGKALPVSKLKGEAKLVPGKTKDRAVILRPTRARQGSTQAYLSAKHGMKLPAEAGSSLEISLRGLGSDKKGTATYKVPLKKTSVVHYACPMHPDQRSEDPGTCKRCKMALKRSVQTTPKNKTSAGPSYVCPMHPKVTAGKPGKCPECGMSLKKTKGAQDASYVCPMHPKVTSDKPGRCPDCGMSLRKRAAKKTESAYSCPMHPEVTAANSGRCPKCGMKLKQ